MEQPLVSIIIPYYNASQWVGQTLASVAKQSYPNIEVIICDDGSTEPESLALKSIVAQWPSLVCLHRENGGQSAARNSAIAAAKGEYILPLDADDLIGEHYVARAVEVLVHEADVKIVYCRAEYFGQKEGPMRLGEFDIRRFAYTNQIFSAALFRREDWARSGGYVSGLLFWEDWDFWISVLELGGRAYQLPEVMFFYRVRGDGMRKLGTKQVKQRAIEMLNRRHADFFALHLGGPLRNIRKLSRIINKIIGLMPFR